MDLGYHGEITTPSQCGRMDQCCAFGNRPVLMTFDGDRLDCDELNLKCTIHLLIVELDGTKASAAQIDAFRRFRAPALSHPCTIENALNSLLAGPECRV
eukprot:scaffold20749_cov109-Isochrysis_galbana.AAC.4